MNKRFLARGLNYGLVFLVSVLILASEILWVRIFNIREGQNYTALLISLALLGFGFSGTVLFVFKEKIAPKVARFFLFAVIVYLLSFPQCFFYYALIPFNALEILWDSKQVIYFSLQLVILLLNFTLGSMALGLSFWLDQPPSTTYFYNLTGSACGAALALLLCYIFNPVEALWALNWLGIGGVALYLALQKAGRQALILVPLLVLNLFLFSSLTTVFKLIQFSEYKAISSALRLPESQIIFSQHTPEGTIQVVTAKGLRRLQGLSYNFTGEIPVQKIIYLDGNQEAVILPWKDAKATFYLDWCSAALPYTLLASRPRQVLLIGISGESLVRALRQGVEQITVLEKNYFLAAALKHELAAETDGLFNLPQVDLVSLEPRAFLKSTPFSFDLIEITLHDSLVAPTLPSLTENYLYTCEAFYEMYQRLSPQGILAITRWATSPYHDALKLWATLIAMLRDYQIPDYLARLAFVRSSNTVTLCLSKGKLDPEKVKAFCESMSFDGLYYPGISRTASRRYFIQQDKYLEFLIARILEEKEPDLSSYPYDLTPATDDRPYFYNAFQLKTFRFLDYLKEELPFHRWGAGIILLLLGPLTLLSLGLILIPLYFKRWSSIPQRQKVALKTVLYFGAIGCGYFCVQLPLIQKLALFLSHPLYSFTFVLVAMLFFSGLGSLLATHLSLAVKKVLSLTLPALLCCLLFLEAFLYPLSSFDLVPRLLFTLGFISLPALMMGFPLPQVLAIIKDHHPVLVPLAWAVNGFASVISSLAAVVLAMFWGLKLVFGIAILLYTGASLLFIFYFARLGKGQAV